MKQSTPLKRKTGLKSNKILRGTIFIGPYTTVQRKIIKKYKPLKNTSNPEIQEADSKFSKIIIARDGKCLNCGSPYFLSCSHFHGRSNYAVRWDPDNCITLCLPCHEVWESKKQGIYADFMETWLGRQRFLLLNQRAAMKIPKEGALAMAMQYIKYNYQDNEIEY